MDAHVFIALFWSLRSGAAAVTTAPSALPATGIEAAAAEMGTCAGVGATAVAAGPVPVELVVRAAETGSGAGAGPSPVPTAAMVAVCCATAAKGCALAEAAVGTSALAI